jgi:hypothetical protein
MIQILLGFMVLREEESKEKPCAEAQGQVSYLDKLSQGDD